jgi:hypothetical protein
MVQCAVANRNRIIILVSAHIFVYVLCAQEFFAEQLKKHDALLEIIEKNLAAQTNILRALTEANARFAGVRKKVQEVKAR